MHVLYLWRLGQAGRSADHTDELAVPAVPTEAWHHQTNPTKDLTLPCARNARRTKIPSRKALASGPQLRMDPSMLVTNGILQAIETFAHKRMLAWKMSGFCWTGLIPLEGFLDTDHGFDTFHRRKGGFQGTDQKSVSPRVSMRRR